MDQGKISDYLGKLQSHIHVIPLNLGFEKGCQRRSKNPPLAGVKVHHLGVVDAAHFMCSRTG